MFTDILEHFFPEGLLDYFTITRFVELCELESKSIYYEVSLEENNVILSESDPQLYESKGFKNEFTLQYFPIRGKGVYLKIKRRVWRLKTDHSKLIQNDFSFIADNKGFTKDFSSFLKEYN